MALAVSAFVGVAIGSVSKGAGGGVVNIVQPIQPEITRTNRTNKSTGTPIAHSRACAGKPVIGAKNAAKYTRAIIKESMKIKKP